MQNRSTSQKIGAITAKKNYATNSRYGNAKQNTSGGNKNEIQIQHKLADVIQLLATMRIFIQKHKISHLSETKCTVHYNYQCHYYYSSTQLLFAPSL